MGFVGRTVAALGALANWLFVVPLSVLALWLRVRDPPDLLTTHLPPAVNGLIAALRSLVHEWPAIAVPVAVLLLLLNLRFLTWLLPGVARRRFITSHAATGESRVALSAIKKALRASARQVPEVSRVRVRVLATGRHRYKIPVRFYVRDVASAGSAAEHLRILLKRRFSELVLLDPRDRVDFEFDLEGIVRADDRGDDPKRLPAPRESAEARPEAFKGPIYPVGGEIS